MTCIPVTTRWRLSPREDERRIRTCVCLVSNPRSQKGLRDRNSPTCTLSQNGYGDVSRPSVWSSLPLLGGFAGETPPVFEVCWVPMHVHAKIEELALRRSIHIGPVQQVKHRFVMKCVLCHIILMCLGWGTSSSQPALDHPAPWEKQLQSCAGQVRCSIVVSISACHAEDPGSIPGGGVFFKARPMPGRQ